MPELDNSARVLLKATYAPIQPDINLPLDKDYSAVRKNTLRAYDRLNFVNWMSVSPKEIPILKSKVRKMKIPTRSKQPLIRVIDLIGKMSDSSSPAISIKYASQFANIKDETVLKLAKMISKNRHDKLKEIESTISDVKEKYDGYRRKLLAKSKVSVNHKKKFITDEVRITFPVTKNMQNAGITKFTLEGNQFTVILRDDTRKSVSVPTKMSTISDMAKNIGLKIENSLQKEAKKLAVEDIKNKLLENTDTIFGHDNVNSPQASGSAAVLEDALKWADIYDRKDIDKLKSYSELFVSAPSYLDTSEKNTLTVLLARSKDSAASIDAAMEAYVMRKKIEPVGRLHLERLEMKPVGIERGELVYSVPLAPKESVTISHREWQTRNQEFSEITEELFEEYSEEGVAEKTDISLATDSQSQHSSALNISTSGEAWGITFSTSYSNNSAEATATKDSRNHSVSVTRKASARSKREHKFSIKTSGATGVEEANVRVLTNPSDSNAMRIDYYQLVRKWKVDLIRYGLRMTYDIVVPNPGSALMKRYDEIHTLDSQIEEYDFDKFFTLKINDLDPNNEYSWKAPAERYSAGNIEPPPRVNVVLEKFHKSPLHDDDDEKETGFWGSYQFDVTPGYEIWNAHYVAVYNAFTDVESLLDVYPDNRGFHFSRELGIQTFSGNLLLDRLSGNVAFTYHTRGIFEVHFHITYTEVLKRETIDQWRLKTWTLLRDAALAEYDKSKERLREKRDRLTEGLFSIDPLSLRKLEREEIMKSVLSWLLGPRFKFQPSELERLFELRGNDGMIQVDPLAYNFDEDSWRNVHLFGEFVKFINHAIEWENMIFFLYPYFWDKKSNWDKKLLFNHNDLRHREFLRAGMARVVLTIRPSFEDIFTKVVDQGSFGKFQNGTAPYVTISDEIRNYANTNYPGIPPANPTTNVRPLIYPEQEKAWNDMQEIAERLRKYKDTNNNKYPTTAEGLRQLGGDTPTIDPWGHPFAYQCPGIHGEYDLVSYGADGQPDSYDTNGRLIGEDKNRDITSWAEGSQIATWYEYTPTSALDISLDTLLPDLA